MIRIVLIPLLVAVLLTNDGGGHGLSPARGIVGAGIFALAAITDWLDGYLARRRREITPLGQMLDPLADKLLTSAAIISLVQLGVVQAWMATIIIGREFAITALRSVAQARGLRFAASSLGKTKMAAQVVAILLLILGVNGAAALNAAGQLALWAVLALSLVSAVDYVRRFRAVTRHVTGDQSLQEERKAS
jgi:CDP-diacylglycerol--glycerol-3-phosphate 3-phosphatidyltransferase